MKLDDLLHFVLCINAAVDTGKYQNISVEDVEGHIEKGDLLSYLKNQLGDNARLDLFVPIQDLGVPEDIDEKGEMKNWIKTQIALSKLNEKAGAELIEGLQNTLDCYGGGERRKWGVQNSGLCLLVAWTTGLIFLKEWD